MWLRLLLRFLRAFHNNYGHLPSYFLVKGCLLVKDLHNVFHVGFLVFQQVPHAVYPLVRTSIPEITQYAVHRHAAGMVVLQIFGFPFQDSFTEQEELYHLLTGIVDLLAEMTDLPVLFFQSSSRNALAQNPVIRNPEGYAVAVERYAASAHKSTP